MSSPSSVAAAKMRPCRSDATQGVVPHRITPLHAGVRRSQRRTVPSADAVRNSSVTASMLTLTTWAV